MSMSPKDDPVTIRQAFRMAWDSYKVKAQRQGADAALKWVNSRHFDASRFCWFLRHDASIEAVRQMVRLESLVIDYDEDIAGNRPRNWSFAE